MNNDPIIKILTRRQSLWDISLCIGLVISSIIILALTPHVMGAEGLTESILFALFNGVPVIIVLMMIFRAADTLVRRHIFKSYYIEDCGDLVKLHGSVPINNMNQAYKDLLGHRHGFKITENAFAEFGCTLAAVKMPKNELDSASLLHRYGFNIATMS